MIYERFGDIFTCDPSYSMAHCISADARMSKGIAVQFLNKFPVLKLLRNRNNTLGSSVAVFIKEERKFIYNLVTKPSFWMKPRVLDIQDCLNSMLHHAVQNGVTDISIPRLASGCDRMNFETEILPIF